MKRATLAGEHCAVEPAPSPPSRKRGEGKAGKIREARALSARASLILHGIRSIQKRVLHR